MKPAGGMEAALGGLGRGFSPPGILDRSLGQLMLGFQPVVPGVCWLQMHRAVRH